MKSNYKAILGHLRAGLLIGACGMALSGITVHAQTPNTPTPQNPNTSQTDQSEEDWRKSRKKRDTTDIFEDILNPNSSGRGAYQTGPINPIDSLPDSSRRHLYKERAKAMAEAPIGAPINTDYTPSTDAQADPDLEEQERLAWSEMMSDVNDGMGMDPSSGQGGAPKQNTHQGQNQGYGQNPGQGQGQGKETGAGEQSKMPSLMRGGSSASIADILAGIKGGQSPQGADQGTGQDIQSGHTQNSEAQHEGREATQGNETASGMETESSQTGQASADAIADNGTQGSQQDAGGASGSDSSDNAESQDASASQSQAEPMSPLERAQSDRSRTTGNRTSASDYLNRFKKKKN